MANSSGSKIEASNIDFTTLLTSVNEFLTQSERTVGLGNSAITEYAFPTDINVPHATSITSESQNNKILNTYAAPFNIIYDIYKNNYMKNNNIVIVNEYKNTGDTIPAITAYNNLVNYWKNNGAAACNGACTGYCEGSCAAEAIKITSNTVGTWSNGVCTSCASGCFTSCGVTCQANCTQNCAVMCVTTCGECKSACDGECSSTCKTTCGSNCANTCSILCGTSCSGTAKNGCSDACTGGCASCTGGCAAANCSGGCKGCTGGCTGSCTGGESNLL